MPIDPGEALATGLTGLGAAYSKGLQAMIQKQQMDEKRRRDDEAIARQQQQIGIRNVLSLQGGTSPTAAAMVQGALPETLTQGIEGGGDLVFEAEANIARQQRLDENKFSKMQRDRSTTDLINYQAVSPQDFDEAGTLRPEAGEKFRDFRLERSRVPKGPYRAIIDGKETFVTLNPLTGAFEPITAGKVGITEIKKLTKKSVPAGIIKELSGFKVHLITMREVDSMAREMIGKIGPVAGTFNKLKAQFFANPEFQKIMQKVASLSTIRFDLSGAQSSDKEMLWFNRELLPQLKQPGENFLAQLAMLREYVEKKSLLLTQGLIGADYNIRMDKEMLKLRKKYLPDTPEPTGAAPPRAATPGEPITEPVARQILDMVNGDKAAAKKMAKILGYSF